jgi:hypothetical protein
MDRLRVLHQNLNLVEVVHLHLQEQLAFLQHQAAQQVVLQSEVVLVMFFVYQCL